MIEKRKIQGSKFDPQYSFMVVHTCTLSAEVSGEGRFPGACWLASLLSFISELQA